MPPPTFFVRHGPGLLAGLLSGTALLTAGCVYARPNDRVVHREPAPVMVVAQDDYVYYPHYEVYYSNSRRQYGYRNGNSWAWRPAPPGISLNVLVASPSVRMDFHDSPERHHGEVVRSYPRNWKPADKGHGGKDDHQPDRHDDDRKH
jgi:hypothetical protein